MTNYIIIDEPERRISVCLSFRCGQHLPHSIVHYCIQCVDIMDVGCEYKQHRTGKLHRNVHIHMYPDRARQLWRSGNDSQISPRGILQESAVREHVRRHHDGARLVADVVGHQPIVETIELVPSTWSIEVFPGEGSLVELPRRLACFAFLNYMPGGFELVATDNRCPLPATAQGLVAAFALVDSKRYTHVRRTSAIDRQRQSVEIRSIDTTQTSVVQNRC